MLSEKIVKETLGSFDWEALRNHFEDIKLTRTDLTELCGHVRRFTDLLCKYPRKIFMRSRAHFFDNIRTYVKKNLGTEAEEEFDCETGLIERIEMGYYSILKSLDKCAIGNLPATIRASGIINRACQEYHELIRYHCKSISDMKQFNFMSGPYIQSVNGNTISTDAVLEGLSDTVAMTLIMEAYKNEWFDDETVVLPEFSKTNEEVIFQSGSTQVLALIWRQWQRTEKRRRYLGGDFIISGKGELPPGFPGNVKELIKYVPPEEGLPDREIYDYIANIRLKDRLIQNFVELEVEAGLSKKGIGIINGAALPPKQLISGEEAHAGMSLSETLGYSIVDDNERPGGLRLLEWIRGYAVLKELATANKNVDESTANFTMIFEEAELIEILQKCGLEGDLSMLFIKNTCLHRSCRDMFDCPLIRLSPSSYILFAPSIININIVMVVLSNLSNRGEVLGRKGAAFEKYIHQFFTKKGMKVFAFKANRNGQEFEYDAVVPWDGHLFIFECKNRSLSGNDPVQSYYFDLEVASQAKQVRRLADALIDYPDIIEQAMGSQYVGLNIIPCVLHSLPYSRIGDIDGVYFTDASSLKRFFEQPYLRIKIPHRIGAATLLHRTAVRKFWKKDSPTAEDFIKQLEKPVQIELSAKHLDLNHLHFPLSESEIVETSEVVRTEMTVHSICEAMGADRDKALQEIAQISQEVKKVRSELDIT